MFRFVLWACLATLLLLNCPTDATSVPPDVASGKAETNGVTTNEHIKCFVNLLPHGQVECQMILNGKYLDNRVVGFAIIDERNHVIFRTQVAGTDQHKGKEKVYTIRLDRIAVNRSCFFIWHGSAHNPIVTQVPLKSIPLHDDWTHATDRIGKSEEYLLGYFGEPEYDSRRDDAHDDSVYVLRWEFSQGKELSIRLRDRISVRQWRGAEVP